MLYFDYANIIDVGLYKFSVVYRPKEKYFDVFDNLGYFGEDQWRVLPYFHSITGCDTIFSFHGLGKAKFWKTWIKEHSNNNERLTKTFIHLVDQPTNINPSDIDIAKYIYNCYLQYIYIFRYFIWSVAFTPVVKYTKHMSSNTCAFSSCDWATYKTFLYSSWVSLEAVSPGTRYKWSSMGLEAVFSINIFLHSFTEKLFVH